MNHTLSIRGVMLCVVLALTGVVLDSAAAERWVALKDTDLQVSPGNALDLSSLVPSGAAGAHGWAVALDDGHIGFANRRVAQRFLGASAVFDKLNGGIPDKPGTDALVDQLRRTGYSFVRLHFVDAHLMTGRERDFDFDPEQLDRLYYLMFKLKSAGLYWMVDGMTSDNGGYGNVQPNRYAKKHQAKLDALLSERGFIHWAELVERLWASKNPYTGISPISDPAMLGMILVNEGGIGFQATVGGDRLPDALAAPFKDWLRRRYTSDSALRSAWGSDAGAGESLDADVKLPQRVRGSGRRDVDFARFVADTERTAFHRMDAHVRKLGFGGLTTAYDNWGFLNADVARSAVQWVDMHAYSSLPSSHGQPGSRIAHTSIHSNVARYARELTNSRQWGKPFTVSEYGQPFWNQWRHESAALIPALAAHQGWDAICLFAETPIQNNYGPSAFQRRQAIYPFGVGADPIARAGERLAAMLYVRGDVSPARGRLRMHVDPERALERDAGWAQIPEGLSRLALVTAVGLEFTAMPARLPAGQLSVDITGPRPLWASRIESALVSAGLDRLSAGVGALKDAGIVSDANRSEPQNKLYQTDTGQMTVDSKSNRILITTERTAVVVVRDGNAQSGALNVRDASGPALFAVSSLDGQPLRRSKRMLVWVLTDAMNSEMTFDDTERSTLRKIGAFPPAVRAVSATLRVENESAGKTRIWPLSLAGERRTPLSVSSVAGAVQFALDTASLPEGPALFFEISIE